jgi:NAD(P)-dependent dehydrogenase (short-subunit alcohol dehydrogenase family)
MRTSQDRKVAVITGASRGIGAELVTAFRKLGHAVVANARSIGPSDDGELLTVEGDIADPVTAQRVIDAAVERFGRVDTLVNNAGIFFAKPFVDYTADDFDLMVGVNLAGAFRITQHAVRAMLEQGSGHVVNVTSTLVDHADSHVPSVLTSLTKGGLSAATRSLAIEHAARGVRFNAVSPGIIKTSMHPVEAHEFLGGLHPMGRMGEASDIVEAVLYLESAPFVTGETLHVDGGQVAGH